MKNKLFTLLIIFICILSTYLVYKVSGKQKLARDYSEESYEILKKLEENYINRDNIYGSNYEELINYIKEFSIKYGFTENDIKIEEYKYNKKIKVNDLENIKVNYKTNYKSNCKDNCIVEDHVLTDVTIYNKNIIISKQGQSDKKILVTTYLNGTKTSSLSGLSLILATISNIKNKLLNYSIDFVILTNDEENYGVKEYLKNVNKEDILFSIDINNIITGDNCYMFSGRKLNNEMYDLDIFYQAKQLAKENNLDIKYNPYTKEKLSPIDKNIPKYIYPENILNSLEKELVQNKISYLSFESANLNIYPYNKETDTEFEIIKNSENDNIKYLEKNYPGRIANHLTSYSTLLNKILMQIRIGK